MTEAPDTQQRPDSGPQDTPAKPTRWLRFDCADPDEATAGIQAAVEAIESGWCVVLPTDTVYGIAADSFSVVAVQRLLDAKGRGRDKPPPVLIGDPAALMGLGRQIPDPAKRLAEAFWPGPLTLIIKAQRSLRMDLGETAGTIAVRVPHHELTREILRRTGPLAVSSANRSGHPPATMVDAAIDQLGDAVSVYIDGGPTPGDVPSTIVDFSNSDYGAVLRYGRLTLEELREVVPFLADGVIDGFEDEENIGDEGRTRDDQGAGGS